jgi:hypothetical protein
MNKSYDEIATDLINKYSYDERAKLRNATIIALEEMHKVGYLAGLNRAAKITEEMVKAWDDKQAKVECQNCGSHKGSLFDRALGLDSYQMGMRDAHNTDTLLIRDLIERETNK